MTLGGQRILQIAAICAFALVSCAPARWIVAVRNSTDQEYLVRASGNGSTITRTIQPLSSGNMLDEPAATRDHFEVIDPQTCQIVLEGDLLKKSTSVVIGVDQGGLTLSLGAKSLISEPQLLPSSSEC